MNRKSQTFGLAALVGAGLLVTSGSLPGDSPGSVTLPSSIEAAPLAGRVLYDGAALGMPTRLAVAGDRVIVLDALGSEAVHVIDTGSGALIESFGSRGEGPGQFVAPRSIDVLPSGNAFWVHDVAQQRGTLFSLTADLGSRHRETTTLSYMEGMGVVEPIHRGDSEIIAAGLFENGRLGHLDPTGALVRASGALPPAPEGIPASQVQFIHQGVLRGTPSRDRFALSSMFFTRVELFDRHGASRGFVDAPVELNPPIRTSGRNGSRVAAVSSQAPAGYIDMAVTDNAIYALYSGRDPVEYREDAAYADQVHVFRWNGDFVEALDLGYDAIGIAVSSDDQTLFGIRHYPTVEVVQHELNQPR